MASIPPSDLAYRVLRLEQQLDSYQRLHAEELENIRRALTELKEHVLALATQKDVPANQVTNDKRRVTRDGTSDE
jgi:hypothetical protein